MIRLCYLLHSSFVLGLSAFRHELQLVNLGLSGSSELMGQVENHKMDASVSRAWDKAVAASKQHQGISHLLNVAARQNQSLLKHDNSTFDGGYVPRLTRQMSRVDSKWLNRVHEVPGARAALTGSGVARQYAPVINICIGIISLLSLIAFFACFCQSKSDQALKSLKTVDGASSSSSSSLTYNKDRSDDDSPSAKGCAKSVKISEPDSGDSDDEVTKLESTDQVGASLRDYVNRGEDDDTERPALVVAGQMSEATAKFIKSTVHAQRQSQRNM